MKLKCLLAMLLLTFLSCSNTPAVEDKIDSLPHSEPGKTLIVYFSWSGHTQTVANIIHELIGCDMVEIEPEEKVENLKTSQKQLLEISKALFFQAKLLILDEPTTSLNNDEVEHLFQIIRRLKEKGTAFIFISHKMPEIFRIADRYTVLRNGEFIKSGKLSEITQEEVTGLMVGEKFSHQEVYQKRELGENVLELNGLSGHGFSNVNLTVKKGSIVGLTGLQGAGSSELMQCMFGVTRAYSGEMRAMGKVMRDHSIHTAMKDQIAMLASNRKENSVIPDMNILENMYLSEHTLSAWKPAISKKKEI